MEEKARGGKMSGSQVIRATQMFTKNGKSKQVSLMREIGTGLALGLAVGFVWKVLNLLLSLHLLCPVQC